MRNQSMTVPSATRPTSFNTLVPNMGISCCVSLLRFFPSSLSIVCTVHALVAAINHTYHLPASRKLFVSVWSNKKNKTSLLEFLLGFASKANRNVSFSLARRVLALLFVLIAIIAITNRSKINQIFAEAKPYRMKVNEDLITCLVQQESKNWRKKFDKWIINKLRPAWCTCAGADTEKVLSRI